MQTSLLDLEFSKMHGWADFCSTEELKIARRLRSAKASRRGHSAFCFLARGRLAPRALILDSRRHSSYHCQLFLIMLASRSLSKQVVSRD
jgi:hypothetical protein